MADDRTSAHIVNADNRDSVASQLAIMSQPDGELHTKSVMSTWVLYATALSRRTFRMEVLERYLDLEDAPPREGRSAVLTAGPPGAGKSTLLREFAGELQGYRLLDADVMKDYLIERAVEDGIYDAILSAELADGAGLTPRELASLVHDESTYLVDQAREICVARRENVLIEGTLRWPGHGQRILDRLTEAEYGSVRIIAVDVSRALAHEQARSRWWTGRCGWRAGTEPLGGRFTPPAAIDDCYDDADVCKCVHNVEQLVSPTGHDLTVTRELYRRAADGTFERSY